MRWLPSISMVPLLLGIALAAEPELGKAGAAPEKAPALLRGLVVAEGIAYRESGKTLVELWLRQELQPAAEHATLGQNYGWIAPGTFLGLLRLPGPWTDYKGQPVAAGTYSLRYAVEPETASHTDLTVHRDFLLLVPVEAETDPAPMGYGPLLELAKKASGHPHPAVLALFPLSLAPPQPALTRNELDQWIVGATIGSMPLGLVLSGQAEAL